MKKNKLLDIIIYLLIFLIVVVVGLVVYVNFFIKIHNVSFNLNGATSLESSAMSCTKDLRGCYVIIPNATRNNGQVLGYSKDKDATSATYNIGDKVYVKEDLALYTISYTTNTVTIDKNNVDYLEKDTLSCAAYNSNLACDIKMPLFNKLGYQLSGYGTSNDESAKTPSQYYPNETYQISSSLTLYPKYTSNRRGEDVKFNTKEVMKINGSIVEIEEDMSDDISNMYIGFLNEISNKAPFLFTGQKISLIGNKSFAKLWGKNVVGICYGSTIEGHPLSRSIDVNCNFDNEDYDKYSTLVHEMSHAWDFYYPYKLNGKIGDIGDLNYKTFDSSMDAYNKIFGTDRISAQPDIVALYNKYSSMSKSNRPFDDYAYTDTIEFVAKMMQFYYMKYLVPMGEYVNAYYPDDIKSVLEKYICIASYDYQISACK